MASTRTCYLALVCLAFAALASCDIELRSRVIDSAALSRFTESFHLQELEANFPDHTRHQFFVVVSAPLNTEQRDALKAAGADIKFYFPRSAYLVMATTAVAQQLEREFTFIEKVVPYTAEHRIDDAALVDAPAPTMRTMDWTGDPPMDNQSTEETFAVMMLTPSHESGVAAVTERARAWSASLAALGLSARITPVSATLFSIAVPTGNSTNRQAVLQQVAAEPETHFIERQTTMITQNHNAQWVTQSNSQDSRPIWAAGITGSGQYVGCVDTGVDPNNCMLSDPSVPFPYGTISSAHRKLRAYWKFTDTDYQDEYQGHGTHVAGTLVGSNTNPAVSGYSGMAPDAKLAFYDAGAGGGLSVPWDVTTFYPTIQSAGAHIVSNSWGCDSPGNPASCNTYTALCTSIDKFAHDNPDFLIVFSTGNAGSGSGSITSPATAKNSLAVGATGNAPSQETLAFFSSRGPSIGSRIKPDIVAPGNPIISALSNGPSDNAPNCGAQGATESALTSKSGTSMAAPVVAGSAVLVRQYYSDGWYPSATRSPSSGFQPSAALIKATLLNSATPLSSTASMATLDRYNANGFGRLELDRVLAVSGTSSPFALFVDDSSTISQGTTKTYTKTVYGGADVRVTLVWMDPESSPNSQATLVNNLDLKVQIGQTSYLGNMLSGNVADSNNNVERVIATPPATGATTVTVTVTGTNVAIGPQRFAIVMTADFNNVRNVRAMQADAANKVDAVDTVPIVTNSTDPGDSGDDDGDLGGYSFYVNMAITLDGVDTVDFDQERFSASLAAVLNITADQILVQEMADASAAHATTPALKVRFALFGYSPDNAQELANQLVTLVRKRDPSLAANGLQVTAAEQTSTWVTVKESNAAVSTLPTWLTAGLLAVAAAAGAAVMA